LSAMHSLGKRISSVQFRVGTPVFGRVVKREQQTHRSRVCEPWRCKSSLAHQFHGVEATADRHRTFNPVW